MCENCEDYKKQIQALEKRVLELECYVKHQKETIDRLIDKLERRGYYPYPPMYPCPPIRRRTWWLEGEGGTGGFPG